MRAGSCPSALGRPLLRGSATSAGRAVRVSEPPEMRPRLGPSTTRSSLKPRAAVTVELRRLLAAALTLTRVA